MKKVYAIVAILSGVLLVAPSSASSDFASAWKHWIQIRQSAFGATTPSVSLTPSPKPVSPPSVSSNTSHYVRPGVSQTSVTARITPIRPRESVHTITTNPIEVFTLGVENTTAKTSTRFIESVLLDEATFRLYSNSGIAEDVQNLELEIAGETVSFDTNGRVTVQFHNVRLPRGESLSFPVSIKIKDPNVVSHIPGTLRLRVDRMTARGELSQNVVSVQLRGTPNSYKIVFDPVSTLTGANAFVSGNTYTHISGGMLSAGEEAYVLAANFSASYDDLNIREITLRNTLTGSDIDSFIDRVSARDLSTGKVIATGRFSNGAVKLRFSPSVFVGRNQQASLGFQVQVADPLPQSSLDARFQLDAFPADVIVESKTTGRELPDSNKNFSVDSEPFSLSRGKMTISPVGTQYSFAVGTDTPETVFRFLVHGGPSNAAIGRISFGVYPSGCIFDGGSLDPSDIELVRIHGSQEYPESATITASGNTVMVDFPTEFYVSKNNSVQFGLRVKLDDISGNADADSVAVKILGDSVYASGTLSSVRSTGSNFIWSDTSARMHSVSTTDWVSGYLVSGIPSNTVVVKRFGN